MQQVCISVCGWCGKYKGYAVYEDVAEGNEPVIVSDGICPACAERQFMPVAGFGDVMLASPAEVEAGKAEEMARFAPEGGE